MMLLLLLRLGSCVPTDHVCSAAEWAARAREPGITHDLRVQRLYHAHREHLFLYDQTHEPRALCDARKALAVARAAVPIPADMVPRFEKTEAETAAREREAGVVCESTRKRSASAPATRARLAQRPAPRPELAHASTPTPVISDSPLLDVPVGHAPASSAQTTAPARAAVADVAAPAPSPSRAAAASLQGAPTQTEPIDPRHPRPAPPRSGRGFLLAGGFSLGAATLAGGLAALGAARHEALERQLGSLRGSTLTMGFSDPAALALRDTLVAEADRARGLAVGAAVTTAVVATVGAVLVGVGSHRRAVSRRLALGPTPRGLWLLAHF